MSPPHEVQKFKILGRKKFKEEMLILTSWFYDCVHIVTFKMSDR